MADDKLKELVSQGLSAMKAGSDVAARATDEISNDASHPDLKAALEQGNSTSKSGPIRSIGQWSKPAPVSRAITKSSKRITR